MTALGILLVSAGVMLLYSGVKDEDPRDVVLEALGRTPTHKKPGNPSATGKSGLDPATGQSGGGTGGGGGTSW